MMKIMTMTKVLFTSLISFSLIAALTTTAQAKPSNETQKTLHNTQWLMTTEHYQMPETVRPEFSLELEGEQVKIHGNTGCNNFFGVVELKGDVLKSKGPIGMTHKLCQDLPNRIEFEFMQSLERGLSYQNGVFKTTEGAIFEKKIDILTQ